jgi:hypothetical protein
MRGDNDSTQLNSTQLNWRSIESTMEQAVTIIVQQI